MADSSSANPDHGHGRYTGPGKAYKNLPFLTSPDARLIRIMCEITETQSRLRKQGIRDTIVFFGSARIRSKTDAQHRLRELQRSAGESSKIAPKLARKIAEAEKALQMAQYYEAAVALAAKLTRWAAPLSQRGRRFVICSGGGPGIMEAANRGASEAGGVSVGLNITLPQEQHPNPYQTPDLAFEFHYFFIRKFWFFYLAKALVVFPGGFGTLDEFFELLTLSQTKKFRKYMPVILFGSDYWRAVLNFDAMIEAGTIDHEDMQLFHIVDDVDQAFNLLREKLTKHYVRRGKASR